jgi:hypothetical protein
VVGDAGNALSLTTPPLTTSLFERSFVAQGFNGVESRCLPGGAKAEEQTHGDRYAYGSINRQVPISRGTPRCYTFKGTRGGI